MASSEKPKDGERRIITIRSRVAYGQDIEYPGFPDGYSLADSHITQESGAAYLTCVFTQNPPEPEYKSETVQEATGRISREMLVDRLGRELGELRQDEIDLDVYSDDSEIARRIRAKTERELIERRMRVQELRRALGIEPLNLGEDVYEGLKKLLVKLLPTDEIIRLTERMDGDISNGLLDALNEHLMEVVPEIFNSQTTEVTNKPVKAAAISIKRGAEGQDSYRSKCARCDCNHPGTGKNYDGSDNGCYGCICPDVDGHAHTE